MPPRGTGPLLYDAARELIPGGVQLLSKRPELFAPEQWPAYFAEARGCEVVDLDGKTYIDFTHCGVGACLLGYAHPQVTAAVVRRVECGSVCTLNSPEEVELARALVDLHPWSDQVRLARGGGEALAIAVRIARAQMRRDVVAFCGYHGWHDWYLAANLGEGDSLDGHLLPGLQPAGVPRSLRGTALPFAYNRIDQLREIVASDGPRLAAVVMEPLRNAQPAPGFLEDVRALCDSCGARLIFDEVTTGFRLRFGGAHGLFGVDPDVAVYAKALGNGHPIAAVIGRREVMEAAQDSFISSTSWTDGVGPAAAVATLGVMRQTDVPRHVRECGEEFRTGLTSLAERHRVPLVLGGLPALTSIGFDHPEAAALGTMLTVRMLDRRFLCGSAFYPTLAHRREHIDRFLAAAEPVLAELADAIEKGDIRNRIGGPVRQSGFTRLT